MREILFKAKILDSDEWVEGYYVKGSTRHCILKSLSGYPKWDIDPDTLCQYTGLIDNNGNKIWENDILHCKNRNTIVEVDFITQVEWDDIWKGFIMQDTVNSSVGLDAINPNVQGIYEVVEHLGNAFDNPELLKNLSFF